MITNVILVSILISLSVVALIVGQQKFIYSYPLSDAMFNLVFLVRFPRILGAIVIGAGLATVGAVYQAAFKNPIVSPSILGVTSGAGIGAALCMLTGMTHLIGLASVVFGCATVYLVWNIAKLLSTESSHLIVIGVIISGVAASILSLIKFLADPNGILPSITFWLMGSLTNIRIGDVGYLFSITIFCYIFYLCRWRLDILSQPSDIVKSLGVNERKNIAMVVFGATVIASFSAAISGVVGMIGLAIPHLVRMVSNTDEYRLTMFHIQIAGAIFLLLVDTVIRVMPVELPVGILTNLFGAVIFGIALCHRLRRSIWR